MYMRKSVKHAESIALVHAFVISDKVMKEYYDNDL